MITVSVELLLKIENKLEENVMQFWRKAKQKKFYCGRNTKLLGVGQNAIKTTVIMYV